MMRALLALLLALPAAAAPRVAPVTLPAAPLLAPAAVAFPGLPAPGDFRLAAEIPAPPPAMISATGGNGAAAAPAPARTPGQARAAAALAAITDLAGKAPEPSASLEDSASHARAVAGLMTSQTVRGPPSAPQPEASPDSGVVRVADVKTALAALRAASYPRHADADALVARLAAEHPELPLDPESVFLVKDDAALAIYGVPAAAAGAARIVSDGRGERKIVILVAPRGVSLDDFVEYAIHEAVHLRDDGILRISSERFVEHWLAEGWTQLRSHEMANASLKKLGRPERQNGAYSQEVALVKKFIARHGEAPLRELVERGSPAGMARALGARWDGLLTLAAEDSRNAVRQREWFLKLMEIVVEHPEFGPLDFRNASRALNGERPS